MQVAEGYDAWHVSLSSQDLPRKTFVQDLVRGIAKNLTIEEHLRRSQIFLFCLKEASTVLNCLERQNCMSNFKIIVVIKRRQWRKWRIGWKQEVGQIQSKSYNFETRACQVSINFCQTSSIFESLLQIQFWIVCEIEKFAIKCKD